jgi:hypothetical protein
MQTSGFKHLLLLAALAALPFSFVKAQDGSRVLIDGKYYTLLIQGKDSFYIAEDLQEVQVTSLRFSDNDEYRKYLRYRKYAALVYPYAVEAIKTYRQTQADTEDLRKGRKRRYYRQLQKEKDDQYEDKLKNLTKTQGYILIKMIERELNKPFFEVVKELRGGFTAFYWNQFSKFYGYDLKHGYVVGEDRVLDAVLPDFNIKYTVEEVPQ